LCVLAGGFFHFRVDYLVRNTDRAVLKTACEITVVNISYKKCYRKKFNAAFKLNVRMNAAMNNDS